MILINGQPENRINVADRGLQYGDGLFETLAFRNGELEFLDAHLKRLKKGCERLKLPFTDLQLLKAELAMLCAQTAADCVIKIIITRGEGGRGYKAAKDAIATRILSTHPLPDYPDSNQSGVTVRLCEHRLGLNPVLAGIKHMNRLDQVLARNEWDDDEIKEGLMLDLHDRLIEGTMSNLFLVKDGLLMTPQLSQAGIEGIMRSNIMQLAAAEDMNCLETDLSLQDLKQADEVFICNSLIGIWPVTRLKGQEWKWVYGAITRRLQAGLNYF